MSELYNMAVSVSAKGGDLALIDSLEEKSELQNHFKSVVTQDEGEQQALSLSREQLNLDGAYGINPGPSLGLESCQLNQTQDCYQLLMPIPEGAKLVAPVYSGAMFRNMIDYVPISNVAAKAMFSPLEQKSKTAEDERKALETVVDRYEELVAPNDFGGGLGNYVSIRGQQDCVDEISSNATLLHYLSSNSYLQHHSFDALNFSTSVGTFHHTSFITGPQNIDYAVDTWMGDTSIDSLNVWRVQNESQAEVVNELFKL